MLGPYLQTDAYRRRFFEPLLRTNHPILSAAMSSQRWPADQPLSRVLAVDDDILMRMLLGIYMKHCDCSVDIVSSVSQALIRLTRQRYSLIIIDGHLGDGTAATSPVSSAARSTWPMSQLSPSPQTQLPITSAVSPSPASISFCPSRSPPSKLVNCWNTIP